MSDFTDLQDRVTQLEDNADQNSMDLEQQNNDLNQTLEDIQNQIQTDEETLGQLTFPLSQDTIDLISEQAPAILKAYVSQGYGGTITLVGGTYTLLNSNIGVDSIIIYSTITSGGIPVIAVGDKHLYYEVVITAGQAVFTSSLGTDTSTLSYLIL